MAATEDAACVWKPKGALCWLKRLSAINQHLALCVFYALREARLNNQCALLI